MSAKKPIPLIPPLVHSRCPICGELSYSRNGVHPQCSAQQADENSKSRIKRDKPLRDVYKAAKSDTEIDPLKERCPVCSALQQDRITVCECGHVFNVLSLPAAQEGGRP